MLKFIKANSNTCLHHEYQETLTHLKSTFEEQGFWGRRVLGDDDIYWEYKGASSVILHENSTKLLNELVAFMEQYYPSLPAFWPVFLNCLMCKNNTAQYPLSTKDIDPLDEDLAEKMLGIRSNNLIIDHFDRSPMNKKTFYHKAYHWNRKASYWRCTVSDGNKPIDINHK